MHIVPNIFRQLHTLHGFYRKQMISMAHLLLPNKEKYTFVRMFQLVSTFSLGLTFRRECFQLDDEVSAWRRYKKCSLRLTEEPVSSNLRNMSDERCRTVVCKPNTKTPK